MEDRSKDGISCELCTAALNSLGTGAVITDADATIVYVNKAFEEITGYTAQEAIGQSMSLLKSSHQSKEFYVTLWEEIENIGKWRGALWNKRKNGEVYHERLNIRRFYSSGSTYYVGIFSDISEQDELQRALVDAQKRELMVTMIGSIAHNCNNYMAAIIGFASLGIQAAKDEKIKRYFSEISRAIEKHANLMKDLMKISRKSKAEGTQFDLVNIIQDSINTEKFIMPGKIKITPKLPDGDSCWVKGDPTDIEQTLFNLINNARDALKDAKDPEIRIEVTKLYKDIERCQQYCPKTNCCPISAETHVMIEVEDNGSGIPEDMQDKVFTPFFTTKDPDKGTGLGLASVNQVVRQLGGAIWLASQVDVGTCFTVCLPSIE